MIDRVRAAVGRQFPIDIRISATEYIDGGYGLAEGIEIAKMLDGKVDLLHISAGTQQEDYSAVLMHPGAFQQDMHNGYLAAEIKKHVTTPVVTVGAFNMPDAMAQFMADTGVDAIAMGRALIADPFLPRKVLENRPQDITPCIRCTECQSGMMKNRVMRCTVNPYIGREAEVFHPQPTYHRKKILIAGGGPAGMEAALRGVERGHEVILCEQSEKLGALRFADNDTWFKLPMRRYRDSQIEKVMRSGAEVRLNTAVTAELVQELQPDVLIAAVGGEPFGVPVPGADGENVVYGAYITPDTQIGKSVVIIGGGFIGCEEAVDLANKGHDVVILEMIDTLAANAGRMHRIGLMHELDVRDNITAATGMRCTAIDSTGVYALDSDNNEVFFPCDTGVMAYGMRARSDALEALPGLVKEFYVIGDARKAGKIMHATRDAYDAVVALGY